MSFILTDEMLILAARVLKGLEVSPKNMQRNLESSQGAILAERVVNMLVEKGVARQEAYNRVRRVAVRSFDSGVPFSKAIQEDAFVSKRLTPKEIKVGLDYRNYLGVTSQLINMALNE
jgi:adenylosuccinate lyase